MTDRRDGILYVGVTSNLPRRVHEHREGLIDGFTNGRNKPGRDAEGIEAIEAMLTTKTWTPCHCAHAVG